VPVTRPRVRAADGSGELRLPSYDLFSSTEILGQLAMEKMLAGLSSRRYPAGLLLRSNPAVDAVAISGAAGHVSGGTRCCSPSYLVIAIRGSGRAMATADGMDRTAGSGFQPTAGFS
jgi:hypothetical protein